MKISRTACLLVIACIGPHSASAQSPAALVEDVKGQVAGLEIMDYLLAGRTLRLGADETIVIDYLNSCVRETIQGGTVKIGLKQSEVQSGAVERETVECDAGKMLTTSGQDLDDAGYVFREAGAAKERLPKIPRAPDPEFTLYGLSPLIELDGSGKLVIGRIDQNGEYFNLDIDEDQLLRRRFLDFATEGRSLTAGGVYGARWKNRLTVFRIDKAALPGQAPILGRLLRLEYAPG
jgi:hypothetical protein